MFCVSTKIFSDFHFCMVPGFLDLLLGSKIKNLFLTKNWLQPLSLKTIERYEHMEILLILEELVEIFQYNGLKANILFTFILFY